MNKDTLISLYVVVLFVLISTFFSCSKDPDLVADYQLAEDVTIGPLETEQNENDTTEVNVSVPLRSPFPYCQSASNPIGGGIGYTDILTPADANIYIETFTSIADFKNAIENAPAGSIIYIDDQLDINLTGLYDQTGSESILVPEGVTIASGRGKERSAHIFTNDFANWDSIVPESKPLFRVGGINVRFTGIRLQGPSQDVGSSTNNNEVKVKSAISVGNSGSLEVDNCELYGWPYTSIQIGGGYTSDSLRNKIHHNKIYNNRQNNLGYGIMVDYGFAVISGNIFMSNRHDIAGSGKSGSGYEASCNLIKAGGTSHNFDMHAEGPKDGTPNAGDFIFIHHNDFEVDGDYHNIVIRGRPEIQCRIENNRFKHADPNSAILQKNPHRGYGNMLVWNNIYNEKDYLGWYVKKKWLKSIASNFVNLTSSNDNLMQAPASGSDYAYDYAFGDYDGDGNTDIFKLENGILYTLPLNILSSDKSVTWKKILTTSIAFGSLSFGFFDGDNRTDIIKQNGNTISISSGANTAWKPILDITQDLSSMQTGDFDGNGVTDLFLASGTNWWVSYDSHINWQILKNSSDDPDQLKLGFFNSNKKSDVLKVDASSLMVSYDGISGWTNLGSTTFDAADLEIVDFDGDNLSDIMQHINGRVFINGNTAWQECQTDNFPIDVFPFGDF